MWFLTLHIQIEAVSSNPLADWIQSIELKQADKVVEKKEKKWEKQKELKT